ncbi:hypothetical protein MMC29_002984 [Sticta canariensis]|nr:hypothetical protein [Sticta canariensis]
MVEGNPHIAQYVVDTWPHEAHAMQILRKIAYLVEPIMRRRRWRLDLLCEFFPDDDSILGRNYSGNKIFLRLRYCDSVERFLPMEIILGTMLHELAHIVYFDHEPHFFHLVGELEYEYANFTAHCPQDEVLISAGPAAERTTHAPGAFGPEVWARPS